MDLLGTKRRCPAVVAGLAATLGVTAALTAAPGVAHAEELLAPSPELNVQDEQQVAGGPESTMDGVTDAEPNDDAGLTNQGDGASSGAEDNAPEADGGVISDIDKDNSSDGAGVDDAEDVEDAVTADPSGGVDGVTNATNPESDALGDDGGVDDGAIVGKQEADVLVSEASDQESSTTQAENTAVNVVHPESGWVVKDEGKGDGLQRYYVENDVKLTGLFQAVINGMTEWFFGCDDGYVVRGKYIDPETGYVYLANNDGVLEGPGWLVTDKYDGRLERYYIDANAHAAKPGYSEDGWAHFTTADGYVLRGVHDTGNGRVYLADNNGKLASADSASSHSGWAEGSGWLVTNEFANVLQRYFIDAATHAAVSGYFAVDGDNYFGLANQGYVLRGFGKGVFNDWLAANNDGVLAADQWVVTDAFGQGLQRYWFDSDGQIADEGLIQVIGDDWAYVTEYGYVLRGKFDNGFARVYVADNDGILAKAELNVDATGSGWLVTDAYDGVMQRYWIDGVSRAAVTGFFTAGGQNYFSQGGNTGGYVLRGAYGWFDVVLLANNDGKMVGGQGTAKTAVTNHGSYGGNWLITDEYSTEGQRYFIVAVSGQSGYYGALIGEFSVGKNAEGEDIKYYGRDDTGYVVRGYYRAPNGKGYYGDNDGVLQDNLIMLDGGFLSEFGINAWNLIANKSSRTQYMIAVDRTNCHVIVFQGSAGNWNPIYDWLAGTGNPALNPDNGGTLRGDFEIGGDGADPYYAKGGSGSYRTSYDADSMVTFFTCFVQDLGFHSTVGNYNDHSQLGQQISHGCIRLLQWQAKWIYDNATVGTHVFVF